MPTVPAGQRSWKCPECGREVMLSVSQLDPMACDACLSKMRGSAASSQSAIPTVSPLGYWSSLGETTQLAVVAIALVIGLVIGYLAGSKSSPSPVASPPHHSANRARESAPVDETASQEESTSAPETEKRPDPPGPGYHWVKGRKHKDGTYGSGHWAKDPKSSDAKDSQ